MSIKVMTEVWDTSPYRSDRLLLHLALADFASDDGICWPSHSTLARKAKCSTDWARKTIKIMVADGQIEIVEQAGKGRGKVGRYRLTTPRILGQTQTHLDTDLGQTAVAFRSDSDASLSILLNHQEPSLAGVSDFDRLWALYPRKIGKAAARKAFDRVTRSTGTPPIGELCTAVEQYANQISELRYCLHLATWLHGERWADGIQAVTVAAARLEPRIDSAMSAGASHRLSGMSEQTLIDSLAHRPADEQAAALEQYRR